MTTKFLATGVVAAATVLAAVGISGCSSGDRKNSSPVASSTIPVASSPAPAGHDGPLPAPEVLTDVLTRLADPAVAGVNKVSLVEGATPDSAATLDKFTNALRDNGYLPMTFAASNVAWSDKHPANVMATITVTTAQHNRGFTFPMEFTPYQGGWQLSRKTADMLLALGNAAAASPPSASPPAAPAPTPAAPPPSTSAAPTPTTTDTPAPTSSDSPGG